MSLDTRATWAINGRFLTQPKTGVQRYAREILHAIDDHIDSDETLARRMRWELLAPPDAEAPILRQIAVRHSTRGHGHLWEQTILPRMARGGLLNMCNLGPLAHGNQILCLHDANVFLEPTSYSRAFRTAYRAVFPLLARRARAVTTVSSFSATMLDKFGVTSGAPAQVIHNGHEHALRWNAARSKFSQPSRFPRPYVFALGSRAKHKQLDLLLSLAPALEARGIDVVISGGTAAIYAETASETPPNVFPVGFVSDDDLAALFAGAMCFAFPSRTEGFGIPLLEAMVHGAPVITADCASMPEVCGNAALYASPHEPAVWLSQIDRLAANPGLRASLKAKGKARYPLFSWREGARHYLELAASLSPSRAAGPSRAYSGRALGRTTF